MNCINWNDAITTICITIVAIFWIWFLLHD